MLGEASLILALSDALATLQTQFDFGQDENECVFLGKLRESAQIFLDRSMATGVPARRLILAKNNEWVGRRGHPRRKLVPVPIEWRSVRRIQGCPPSNASESSPKSGANRSIARESRIR